MRELSLTGESGKKVVLNEEGFLVNSDDWNEEVARAIATHLDIPHLEDEQLDIIKFMREYYYKFNAFPILTYVCKNVGQAEKCVNDEFVNPMKAWKIAGLPKLDNIHFVSVNGKYYLPEEC